MVLWVAQALRALDRMTPNATNDQKHNWLGRRQRISRPLTTDCLCFGSNFRVYRGEEALEKRLSCPGAAWTEEKSMEDGTTTLLSTRRDSDIMKKWY